MTAKIARTAGEIDEQADRLRPLTEDSREADMAYEALQWVLGNTETTPTMQFEEI